MPAGGAPKVNIKPEAPPTETVPSRVNANPKKGPKDLVGEAIDAKAKETKAAERQAKRDAQTQRGNSREGNSNQGTRGSHNSGGKNPEKHDAGEARRAREQAAADAKKAAQKKN